MSVSAPAAAPRRRVWRPAWLAIAAGLIAALGHPPFSALWAALPGLVLLVRAFDAAERPARAAWVLWWGGAAYFGLALSWIVQPFMVDPVQYAWMAPFAVVFLAGGLALFWALAGWLAFRFGGTAAGRRWMLAVGLTGAELLRGYIFTGFPWALIGHVFIGWPPMQLAAWIGAGGLTLLALVIAALAAPLRPVGLAAALAVTGLAGGYGLWRQSQALPADPGPVLRLVQPDIPQVMKWDPDTAAGNWDNLMELTGRSAKGPAPDLVIWPETAFPYLLGGGEDLLAEARAAAGTRLIVGAIRVDGARGYNSLALVNPDGTPGAIYDKHHLVPFGEYVPFERLMSLIGLKAMTAKEGFGYSAGPGARVLDLGDLGKVLPLICYEAVFPQDIAAAPERADWLLQITNDAWFGTFQGPYQHLAQARLRAVEFGLPMVRVANTGVSAVIDAHGEIRASLGLGQRGDLDAALPAPLPETVYARTGDLPLAVLLALCLAGLGLIGRGRAKGNRD